MTLVLDTSAVLAFYNATDDDHARVVAWLDEVDEDLVTTPLVVAELDRLVAALRRHGGAGAAVGRPGPRRLRRPLVVDRDERDARSSPARRPELRLADASLLALAPVAGTDRIATLDPLPFRARGRRRHALRAAAPDA